jgi:hypothetical protein
MQRSSSYSNGQSRNSFRPTQSPEKLLEKYNTLAKEAMSSGDEQACENYLQHADHFIRIIDDKNKNRDISKISTEEKPTTDSKSLTENGEMTQDTITKSKE